MNKTVLLGLNAFPPGSIPSSLTTTINGNAAQTPVDTLEVSLTRLCHHMFLDTRGQLPPRPNPFFSFYKGFVTSGLPLEFVEGGLGSHKEARIAESMTVGKAFCRWFLDTHFGIKHFAHMEHVIGQTAPSLYGRVRVLRVAKGDTPDYLCSDGVHNPSLAEAKGRQQGSISFTNADFASWRQQVRRVEVVDELGNTISVKANIVATRFRIETEGSRIQSKLFAEDPETEGTRDLDKEVFLKALRASRSTTDSLLGDTSTTESRSDDTAPLEAPESLPYSISILRNGSLLTPASFMELETVDEF